MSTNVAANPVDAGTNHQNTHILHTGDSGGPLIFNSGLLANNSAALEDPLQGLPADDMLLGVVSS